MSRFVKSGSMAGSAYGAAFVAAILCGFADSPAQADVIPAASANLSLLPSGFVSPLTESGFGTLAGSGVANEGGPANFFSESATAAAGPTPNLTATATSGTAGTGALVEAGAGASLTYYFQVANIGGASDAVVPLDVSYFLFGSGTLFGGIFNQGYSVDTQIQIIQNATNFGEFVDRWLTSVALFSDGSSATTCDETHGGAPVFQSSSCTGFSTNPTVILDLTPDTTYRVVLGDDVNVGSGSVTGIVDPLLQIDPGFLDSPDYTIELSSGIGNSLIASAVPEPSSVVLMLGGLLALGAFGSMRKRAEQRIEA